MTAQGRACDLLLVGSSIFEAWTLLPRALPNHTVINRAVGGTQTADWLHRLPTVLAKIQPRLLAMYCGSNDLTTGKNPEGVIERTLDLFRIADDTLPGIPLVYHSIIKAPEKQHRWDDVDRIHNGIRNAISIKDSFHFLDLNPLFFTPAGESRTERFVEDRLHLTDEAYEAMNALCAPRYRKWLSR